MTNPKQIPDEVVKAIYDLFPPGYLESIGLHPESIAAAALNAWPDGWQKGGAGTFHGAVPYPALILPLPQEPRT